MPHFQGGRYIELFRGFPDSLPLVIQIFILTTHPWMRFITLRNSVASPYLIFVLYFPLALKLWFYYVLILEEPKIIWFLPNCLYDLEFSFSLYFIFVLV